MLHQQVIFVLWYCINERGFNHCSVIEFKPCFTACGWYTKILCVVTGVSWAMHITNEELYKCIEVWSMLVLELNQKGAP